MSNRHLTAPELTKMILVRFVGAFVVLGAILFLPAGSFNYWEAWLYLGALLISIVLVLRWLWRNDPELMERRMRFKEKEAPQKLIVGLTYPWFFLAFVLPGLDHRFGWSNVPVGVVLAGALVAFLGYFAFFLVLRENRYLSRIVEVEREQTVISSGPYSIVRHPMYLGVLVMYIFSPLALGSYWAILPTLLVIPILIARILNEESVLARELKGYQEYMQKVRYRLIPGVW